MDSASLMRRARMSAQLGVKEMAAALGVSIQFIYDIERGRRGIPEGMVEKFPGAALRLVVEAFAEMHERRAKELRGLLW